MNMRMLDAAAMLYGSDNSTRLELLKKYHVRYVLWTLQWFGNQYRFNDNGQIVGLFDPFMVPYSASYESYLQQTGVEYRKTRYALDPAALPTYPTYNVLVTIPSQFDLWHPWDYGLDQYLKEIKRFEVTDSSGNLIPYAIVYEVKYD